MDRSERPATGRSSERAVSHWRRDQQHDEIGKSSADATPGTIERAATSGRPQTRIERPVSRRGLQSATGRDSTTINTAQSAAIGGHRATTPARNALARPPSASAYSQRLATGNTRIGTATTSAAGLVRLGTGLPSTAQMNMNALDRPITQQGIAGVRPGTTRGLPMTRQIQDKRYYEGLVQLKIRELTQEIGSMTRELDAQNKERATFAHYDARAKELASELTELQGQLADYNVVVDKTTSNVEQEDVETETREMSRQNDRAAAEIERLFEQRRLKEQQLRDAEEKIESQRKSAARVVETMDPDIRNKYDGLVAEKAELDGEIGKMQREIDLLSRERSSLEEQIALSQVKQEAAKLRVRIIEAEAKRDRLREERSQRLSPEEERERLLAKVKQDNMDIAAAERRIAEAERRTSEAEQELEQLETDLEDGQSEKQVKYRELRKREEAMEQFMPSFEANKREEIEKLEALERRVVERLGELAYAIDNDTRLTPGEELALLKPVQPSQDQSANQSFEGMTREHSRLRQTLAKMETLETRLKSELDELTEKIARRQSELVVLEDLDGLKARSEIRYEELVAEREELKKRQPVCRREVEAAREEHDEIKRKLDGNETYLQISALEGKLEKLRENNRSAEEFVAEGRSRVNYEPLRERAFTLLAQYNVVLRENVKSVY